MVIIKNHWQFATIMTTILLVLATQTFKAGAFENRVCVTEMTILDQIEENDIDHDIFNNRINDLTITTNLTDCRYDEFSDRFLEFSKNFKELSRKITDLTITTRTLNKLVEKTITQ